MIPIKLGTRMVHVLWVCAWYVLWVCPCIITRTSDRPDETDKVFPFKYWNSLFIFLGMLSFITRYPGFLLTCGNKASGSLEGTHLFNNITWNTISPITDVLLLSKMKRGQDSQLSICSYVAEKPCGCLYKLTCCNAKFQSLFKCKLYLWINFIYHSKVLE